MPCGLACKGDFRNGTPIILPHEFGTPVTSTEPFGNVIPQSNAKLDSNPVDWTVGPTHFGNQVGYLLQSVPPIVIVAPGSTGTTDINLADLTGGVDSMTLTYNGAPAGVTVAFAPNPDTGTSVATLTVGAGVALGKYLIFVFGTAANGEIDLTQIQLVVAEGATPP